MASDCDRQEANHCRHAQSPTPEESHRHENILSPCACAHEEQFFTISRSNTNQKKPALQQETGKAGTDSKTVYRIQNMDCPMEEALIRKRLAAIPGIVKLDFNLMQRTLSVTHRLPHTAPLEEALKSISMSPELIEKANEAVTIFSISGMDCPTEEALIRKRLSGMPEVRELEFNLMQRTLKVRHTPSALPEISAALASLNLNARLATSQDMAPTQSHSSETGWKRLAAAGLFAALSEAFELLHVWKINPFGLQIQDWTLGSYPVLPCLPLFLALIAIGLGGVTTYRKGWLAISNFNLNINALMSVAVTGAVIIGQYPEAAMVMVLFNLSEAIEAKALDRARNAIRNLLALAPDCATVRQADGSWQEMDIRQIPKGSRIRVRPGEKIALDGLVMLGESTVNQAPITGESLPVEKRAGDIVYAGTLNESGSFEFESTATATDSTLARIVHAVEEAQGTKAPIQRFVDSFARYYTPAVFAIALLVGLVPPLLLQEPWSQSIYTALVILVIGCPCALVISTPVSIVSGMAAATRSGILVKGGVFLEQGRLLNWLALDKTGTITHGTPRQTDFIPVGNLDESRSTSFAASLAARSDHPVSRAIAGYAAQSGIPVCSVENFSALPGEGVCGTIDGQSWYLGNHRMVERLHLCSSELEQEISKLEQQGKSVVMLTGDAGVQGLFAVADTIRDSSVEAIRELRQLGIKTMMLTGDNEHAARSIARLAEVDSFKSNLLPEDKLQLIEELQRTGNKVGMVGDGINDAPALAKANIGFAMAGNGTDTAIETANVALMDDDLRKIPRFIRLSRATHAILIQNISLALGVKALFFGLTFSGNATMWMAVFADVGTALLVIINGLRAIKK